MLVPFKNIHNNLWMVVREGEAGNIPQDLSGFFTSESLTRAAINRYVDNLTIVTDNKNAIDVDKALWKQAKTVKGMSSREAFNMLKAQYEAEQSP